MKDAIIKFQNANPNASLADLSKEVGCSREYVRQVLADAGIKLSRRKAGKVTVPSAAVIPTTKIGAVSLHLVAADLLKRGFEVFETVSPSAQCDIVCYHESSPDRLVKIKVRSANIGRNGHIQYSTPAGPKHYDCLALCLPAGEVHYRPEEILLPP